MTRTHNLEVCPACSEEFKDFPVGRKKFIVVDGFVDPEKDVLNPNNKRVLVQEFLNVRVDPGQVLFMTLWGHKKGARRSKLDKEIFANCHKFFLERLGNIIKEKKIQGVLIYGSDACKMLTNEKVSEWSGLDILSPYFDAPVVMATEKHGKTLGELRLSIKRFAKKVKNLR